MIRTRSPSRPRARSLAFSARLATPQGVNIGSLRLSKILAGPCRAAVHRRQKSHRRLAGGWDISCLPCRAYPALPLPTSASRTCLTSAICSHIRAGLSQAAQSTQRHRAI